MSLWLAALIGSTPLWVAALIGSAFFAIVSAMIGSAFFALGLAALIGRICTACLRHVRNALAHEPVLDERHAARVIGAKRDIDLELFEREQGLHEVAPLRLVELRCMSNTFQSCSRRNKTNPPVETSI